MTSKIYYNGIQLDSESELKFLISIEASNCFIYHPFRKYEGKHSEGVTFISNSPKHYTPDFLIRNIKSKRAEIVEVKWDSMKDYDKRKRLIDEFLEQKGKANDYGFNWVNVRKLMLSSLQVKKFSHVLMNQENEKKLYFQVSKWISPKIPLINHFGLNDDEYESFVRNGSNVDLNQIKHSSEKEK